MTADDTPKKTPLPIVAIAASAGGLEAVTLFVQNLTSDIPCCYVIAQHMSPKHASMMVELLSRETSLKVIEIEEEIQPEPAVIYLPPPGFDVVFENDRLQLAEPRGHHASPKPSADRLFRSVAENLGEQSIGIVFSGTGTDGSYGVQAIREHGGITIAQEPATCKYDGMPQSAVRTGCIDLTLTPQQMAAHIAQIIEHPRDPDTLDRIARTPTEHRDLFDMLLARTLVDFRNYKEATITRRIQRRMIAKEKKSLDEYIDFCRRSPEEMDALFRDLLISVTNFFRDPEQFESLGRVMEGDQFKGTAEDPIRIWVPGCASGEEAYSIAALACEAMGGLDKVAPEALQIFASDIDEAALKRASHAVYPYSSHSQIPEQYIGTYFEVRGDSIVVNQRLRNFVTFTRHNVIQDPPFIRVDLISLRNLLIYFNAKLQERVLMRMAYALKPGGLLFLGTSESLGNSDHYFQTVKPKCRVFRKLRNPQMAREIARTENEIAFAERHRKSDSKSAEASPRTYWRQFDRLAATVADAGVVINRDNVILEVYGDIAPFVQLTSPNLGKTGLSILRKDLASDAASLAMVSLKTKERRSGQWHKSPLAEDRATQLTAFPMPSELEGEEDLVLVTFITQTMPRQAKRDPADADYVAFLEEELSRTRDALHVSVEQLQSSNEEYQTLNEEFQSSNEELQSTNEELETSNEELQSTNEELITVNEELLVNSAQLERTSAQLVGLVDSIPSDLIMVDDGLLIRFASASAIVTFSLKEQGAGYGHLSHITLPKGYPKLTEICRQVLLERMEYRLSFAAQEMQQDLTVSPMIINEQLLGLVINISSHPLDALALAESEDSKEA